MRGDARRFAEIGFAAYATKPIRHEELKTVLALALTDQEGMHSALPPLVTRYSARETLNRFEGRKARILLAEDNITNQLVALGMLRKLGLSADVVANGAEAVKAIETIPYDLVLMDVQMPVMDGIEATRSIRNIAKKMMFDIPIIAMTARAMQGDRERCMDAGMNGYVAKPISPLALAEVLEKWLPKETATTEKKAPVAPEADDFVSGGDPELPVFDRAGMMARLMDDEDLVQTVVKAFLWDIPKQIEVLRECLETGKTLDAERQAHSIKGASANVGGERLCAAAFEMEKAARVENLDEVKSRMEKLEKELDMLTQAISREFLTG
jgi:CheY-like chemotaxis protein/HPt (histidine-containing phosphotransfer) domain-containing protein